VFASGQLANRLLSLNATFLKGTPTYLPAFTPVLCVLDARALHAGTHLYPMHIRLPYPNGTWLTLWLSCFCRQGQEWRAHGLHCGCLVSSAKDNDAGHMDCTVAALFLQPRTRI